MLHLEAIALFSRLKRILKALNLNFSERYCRRPGDGDNAWLRMYD